MLNDVVLAVDLGGTKVEAALVDRDGKVRSFTRRRVPTGAAASSAELRAAVQSVVQGALESQPPGCVMRGVGIGSAGPLDSAAETISPLNLGVTNFPIIAVIREIVGENVPIRLALDGLCIALAESRFGAAVDVPTSVSMVVSTGVGGGIIVNGSPLIGDHGNAGHIGQLRISLEGSPTDATMGTLESVASGPASVAWARARGWQGATGEELADSARAGDRCAREAIERSAMAVGVTLAGVCALLDVGLVVIGGGFSLVSDDYVDLVQAFARRAAVLPAASTVRIVRAALGSDAPLVGAAQLVM
ncbi:ROK family protein [Microbacterium sp. F51-2R]|uniref:ROK family protein n=1 Tax=Microbacterium sp. F51-2R TaxID=3445777 RepID=UPI003F9F293D